MKRLILAAVVAAVFGGAPLAAEEEYTVVKGDTLWDISKRYTGDPFRWKEIWRNNPHIRNPHRIYPGNRIALSGVAGGGETASAPSAAVSEEAAPAVTAAASPSAPPAPPPSAPASAAAVSEKEEGKEEDTFLAKEDWEFDGYITGQRELKNIIAEGDLVFLDIGRKQGAAQLDQYNVFRKDREMFHPETGEFMGHLIRKVGILQITQDISEQHCTARVLRSREPLQVGDFVKRIPRKAGTPSPVPSRLKRVEVR